MSAKHRRRKPVIGPETLMRQTLMHRCRYCGRHFEDPSVCIEGRVKTEIVLGIAHRPTPTRVEELAG
jgi:hypothetical protein